MSRVRRRLTGGTAPAGRSRRAPKGGNAAEVIARDAATAAAVARAPGGGATAGTWGAARAARSVLFHSVVPVVSQYGEGAKAAPASTHVVKAFDTLFRDVLAAGGLSMAHWLEGAGLLSVGLTRYGVGSFDFSLGVNVR